MATRQTEGDWVRLANEQLSRAGYNHGGARQAIVDLLGQQPCALSAPEIEDALRSSDREVARASVYRVLDELDRLGLVGRVGVGRGLTRYEPVQGGADHHDHLVCDSCGEVIPFRDNEVERALHRASERVSFEVDGHELLLRGHCASCRS